MDSVSYWCNDARAELTPVAEYDVDTPFFDHDQFGLPNIMSAFEAEDDYEMPRMMFKDHAAKFQSNSGVMTFDVEGVLSMVPPIRLGGTSADPHQEPCSPRSSSETNSIAEIPCASPSSTDVSTADVHVDVEMPDIAAAAIKLESTADTRKARALPPKTKRRRGTSPAASKANKKQKRMQMRSSGDESSDGEELRSFQATICFRIVKSWDDFSQNALGEINQRIRQMEAKAAADAAAAAAAATTAAAEAATKEQEQQEQDC